MKPRPWICLHLAMFLKQGVGRPGSAVRGCPGITHQESTLERKVSKFWKSKARKSYFNTCVKTSGEGPGVVQDHLYHCRSLLKMENNWYNTESCDLSIDCKNCKSLLLPTTIFVNVNFHVKVGKKETPLAPSFLFCVFHICIPMKKKNKTNTSGSLFSNKTKIKHTKQNKKQNKHLWLPLLQELLSGLAKIAPGWKVPDMYSAMITNYTYYISYHLRYITNHISHGVTFLTCTSFLHTYVIEFGNNILWCDKIVTMLTCPGQLCWHSHG